MNTNNTQETIRVNNVNIDKYFVYDTLFEILMKRYNKMKQEEDDGIDINHKLYYSAEECYLDTCDFIRDIIGEDNMEEFIEYTSFEFMYSNNQ